MSFPVRWFFWVPFGAFLLFTVAVGSASGSALSLGDTPRFLVLFATAFLGALGATACGLVATGRTV